MKRRSEVGVGKEMNKKKTVKNGEGKTKKQKIVVRWCAEIAQYGTATV